MKQKKIVLNHLTKIGNLDPILAVELYGILRLSARIFNLREDGIPVKTRTIAYGKTKHIAQYYI